MRRINGIDIEKQNNNKNRISMENKRVKLY